MSTVSNSTNIFWQECPVGKAERQKLLNQKGCVIWITGLSGSGKSTLACSLSRELHLRGKLSYILDGDNLRHGFKAEDRTENIRRVGKTVMLAVQCYQMQILSRQDARFYSGFTGIDDPYEQPLNCEIEIQQNNGVCPMPADLAGRVVTYLEEKGFLQVE